MEKQLPSESAGDGSRQAKETGEKQPWSAPTLTELDVAEGTRASDNEMGFGGLLGS